MILDEKYYNDLTSKYAPTQKGHRADEITTAAITDTYTSQNMHFNFPRGYDLKVITNLLYENFSKQIFRNHAEITDYSIGDKLKNNNEKGIYIITNIENSERKKCYFLAKENDTDKKTKRTIYGCDQLTLRFTRVKQSARNSTLSKFNDFFKETTSYGFLPVHFSKKLVLIAGQTMWSNLTNKNRIPSIYLPNTRESEQTRRKSIEALEDCIAYVTPKYDVCYEEVLEKNIAIDIIAVCDVDLGSLPQIIQDQAKFKFKLIVLSSESDTPKLNNTVLWNWQKEEIELLGSQTNSNIVVDCIEDKNLDNLIRHFEECMQYVSSFEIPIKLKSYGCFLRCALNALQADQFDYLLMRLERDKTLEQNEGGYEDFTDKNPKEALKNLISYLQEQKLKNVKLHKTIRTAAKNTFIVADREDADFLKITRNNKCVVITNTELKKLVKNDETYTKNIVFYSFNGSKDFDFIYNLQSNVKLVLYNQEKELYYQQLQYHKKQLEEELISNNRISICGIKYEPILESEIKIIPTLEKIIEQLEQRSNTAYEGYKNESDSLLDDLEEQITYRITLSNGSVIELESNERVFDVKGNLIRACNLQENKDIRIYPKDLAENLIEVAIAEDPKVFGKIEEHSALWKNALKSLDIEYNNRETLYILLKRKGLRVLPVTVDAYFKGHRKFPMYNSDLKAILILSDKITAFSDLIKSKRLYNSTTIALGRGVKQELKQFLQENTLGDILSRKNFTKDTLTKFIDEKMPLLTVAKIKEVDDEE